MFFFIIACISVIVVHIWVLNIAIVHIPFHFIRRVSTVVAIIIGKFTLNYLKLSLLSMRRYICYFVDSHSPLCCWTTAVSRIRRWFGAFPTTFRVWIYLLDRLLLLKFIFHFRGGICLFVNVNYIFLMICCLWRMQTSWRTSSCLQGLLGVLFVLLGFHWYR